MFNVRRTFVAAALSLVAVAASSGAAQASTSSAASAVTASTPGLCTLNNGWGGTFYCRSEDWWQMPNGNSQVFVIGTDDAVWTEWQVAGGLSGWQSMGGIADPSSGIVTWSNSGWSITIDVIGADNAVWFNTRGSSEGSTFGGWYR